MTSDRENVEGLSPNQGNGDGRATGQAPGREEFVARPMDPNDSPGWFGYIAVAIALASLVVGLLVVGWWLYAMVRRFIWSVGA
jgi:hypothetical protein